MKSEIIRVQGSKMLMQRIGSLSPVRQRDGVPIFDREEPTIPKLRRRNRRSPETRGVWAFPYPLFDSYFASFQFELAMPKKLLLLRNELYASEKYDKELDERFSAAYKEWSRLPETRKRLKVRQFWVSGEIYTHLGEGGSDSEWQLMSVPEFSRAMKKQYAKDLATSKKSWQPGEPGLVKALIPPGYDHRAHRGPWPVSVDHLEVFLGRGAHIH